MRYRSNSSLAIAVVLALQVSAAWGHEEEAPPADERRWSNTAELALVQTSGNSESFTFSLRDSFVWNWASASLVTEVNALRAESTNRILVNEGGQIIEESETELTGEQYSLSSKYNRTVSERMGWYGDVGWERNELAGLSSRFLGGAGASYRFVDNETRRFRGEAGLGYASEEPVSGESREFATGRVFGRYERTISPTSGFEMELDVLGNLEDADDFLANFLAGLTARMTEKLALRVSYKLTYDNQPIVVIVEGDDPDEPDGTFEFETTDSVLSASLVIDF